MAETFDLIIKASTVATPGGRGVADVAANKDIATLEVTPQHLTLSGPEDDMRLKGYTQMNPPVRDAAQRAALWQAVSQGIPDLIGSDHAPHTKDEKAKAYPASPSGMPGVQTLLPLMLNHVAEGRLHLFHEACGIRQSTLKPEDFAAPAATADRLLRAWGLRS